MHTVSLCGLFLSAGRASPSFRPLIPPLAQLIDHGNGSVTNQGPFFAAQTERLNDVPCFFLSARA